MRKLAQSVFLLVGLITIPSEAQNFNWAKQMGGDIPLSSTGSGSSVAVDMQGNIYTTGSFLGIVDFDPDGATLDINSKNGVIFICKQDSTGNLMWVKQIGGMASDVGNSIAVDATGHVYVTGNFQGTADFDPGNGIFNLTSNGGTDIFICKLDASGNFVWAKQIGSTLLDVGNSITVAPSGYVYTTGSFRGTADFDPGTGILNLSPLGYGDVFISKLDTAGNFVWAKQMGGTIYYPSYYVGSYAEGKSIAVDALGNVYSTGDFNFTADFDPGTAPGDTFNLSSGSSNKIVFISKLDSSGNFVWAKQIGSPGLYTGTSVAVDVTGNLYVAYFGGYTGFANYISKLDTSGNFVWTKQINVQPQYSTYSIALDASSRYIYTTGNFKGTADFDPNTGVFSLTSNGNNDDIFVSKLDTAGNFLWAKQIGGTFRESSNSIAVDAFENVHTTGNFQTTADFDPGSGTYNLTSGSNHPELFVSKLDSSGSFVWAKQMKNHVNGSALGNAGKCIAVDASGNIYSAGYFNATADFDPGSGTYNLTATSSNEIYVSKLNVLGDFLWTKQISGTVSQAVNSIAVDKTGNVYITGIFQGTVDFDPGSGIFNLTSTGSDDIFVSKLDSLGNFIWAKQIGDIVSDMSKSIAVDASGNAYITGYFQGTIDFDPGSGTFNLTSIGNTDAFISKLDSAGNFVWAKSIGGSKSDVSNSITVDNSGNVYYTGSFWGTVDFDPNSGVVNLVATGNYNAGENKRDSSDIFISKLDSSGNFGWSVNINGINWSDYAYAIKTDARKYVYITGIAIYYVGSADVFPATLVSKIDSIGNVIWTKVGNSQFYPNTATFYSIAADSSGKVFVAGTAGNANSPDVIVNQYDPLGNLVWSKTMGGSLSDKGNSMTLDACGNIYTTGSFQGTADFDPSSGTFNLTTASGATDIFVTKWGNAVNCQTGTSVSQVPEQTDIIVYPNPTNGNCTVEWIGANAALEIHNLLGEKIHTATKQTGTIKIDLSDFSNGVYFLQVKTDQGRMNKKIIIQR